MYISILAIIVLAVLTVFKSKLYEIKFGSKIYVTTVLLLVAVIIKGLFFIADAKNVYVVQFPWGGKTTYTTNGVHFSGWGIIRSYPKTIALRTQNFNSANFKNSSKDSNTAAGVISPLLIRFSDAAQADLYFMTRFQLPIEEKALLNIDQQFGSKEALINNLFKPSVKSAGINSARLMSIQEYITKRGSDFDAYFFDQLANGLFKTTVEEKRIFGEATSPAKVVSTKGEDVLSKESIKNNSEMRIIEVVKPMEKNGQYIRQGTNDLTRYSIDVVTAKVTYVDPSDKVKSLISKQRDAEANAALAENRVRTAVLESKAVKAEGAKKVEETRAIMLSTQTERLIAAETTKEESIIENQRLLENKRLEKETAAVDLEKAKLEAAAIKERANAEAYKKAQILKADNALKEKLEAWKYAQRVWADAYARRAVPSTVLGTSGKGESYGGLSASDFMNILTVKAAKELSVDLNVKK